MGQTLEAVATPPTSTSSDLTEMESRLDDLETLADALRQDDAFAVPERDYDLPPGFKLSIVIPVYNEERTIRTVVSRVQALPFPKEILVVDDCSTDGTRDILATLENEPDVRVLLKAKNAGKGAALRTGFAAATGDVVVVQDADLEYDPRDLIGVVRPLVAGEADVVFGSRFLHERPQDPSFVHRLGNGLLTWASNTLTGLKLTDMETCYKAFRREVLRTITLKQNRFGFEPEITAKVARLGCRVREVPITYKARGYAEGKKIGWRDAFNAFFCIAWYSLAD